jgi:hypothetical protein
MNVETALLETIASHLRRLATIPTDREAILLLMETAQRMSIRANRLEAENAQRQSEERQLTGQPTHR